MMKRAISRCLRTFENISCLSAQTLVKTPRIYGGDLTEDTVIILLAINGQKLG